MAAILELRADTANVMRALGRVQSKAAEVATSLQQSFDRSARAVERRHRNMARALAQSLEQVKAAEAGLAQAVESTQQRVRRAYQDTTRAKRRAAQEGAQAAVSAEGQATSAAEEGARRRVRAARAEAQERRRLLQFDYTYRNTRLSFNGAQAARSFAAGFHGDTQGARGRQADVERTLGGAIFQAGGTRSEVQAAHRRLLAFAGETGADPAAVAAALNAAQTEFSVLSGPTAQARGAALETYLGHARFAQDTGQDPAEVLRVVGLLQQAGVTGGAQRQTLLALTGMAQQGAIELGAVTRSAMAPLQGRMATAVARLGPNATAEQRSQAQRLAVQQTMAELEVARGLGVSPRLAGNTLGAIERSITSPLTQTRMLTNIRSARGMSAADRARVEKTLFEGPRNNRRLRAEYAAGPYGLARGLQTAFQGNSELMAQVFQGGGHGNPQSLQANWRNMLSLMMGGGRAGAEGDRIRALLNGVGRDFTEADVTRGRDTFERDQRAELNRNETIRDAALTDNTAALTRLSNSFADWSSRNPVLAQAGSAVAGAAGLQLIRNAGSGVVAPAAGAAGAGGAGAAAAGGLLASPAAVGALALAGVTTGLSLWAEGGARVANAVSGRQGDDRIRGPIERLVDALQGRGVQQAVAQGVREGMAQTNVAAQSAAAQATVEGQRARPGDTGR